MRITAPESRRRKFGIKREFSLPHFVLTDTFIGQKNEPKLMQICAATCSVVQQALPLLISLGKDFSLAPAIAGAKQGTEQESFLGLVRDAIMFKRRMNDWVHLIAFNK